MLNAYGLPDDGGSSVRMQPGVQPNMAAPSMANGGAIPEDDEFTGDASPNTDVVDYSNAMKVVREALNFGRQQHGLPASRPQQAGETEEPEGDSGAIPEDDEVESFEDGGVIEDDDVAAHEAAFPDDGNDPAESEQQLRSAYPQEEQQQNEAVPTEEALRTDPEENVGAFGGAMANAEQASTTSAMQAAPQNMQQILRYLQRADAMAEPAAQQLEASVSGGGGIGSDAMHDRNEVVMKAVEAAGDDAQRFAYLQRNAKRYEGDLALAYHAAQGTPERPANLGTAAQRANAAFANVPDATDVKFMPSEAGMTVNVRQLGGNRSQQFDLTPQQFLELTKPGGAGQWDRITSTGGVMKALNSVLGGGEEQPGAQPRQSINASLKPFEYAQSGKNNIGFPQGETVGRYGRDPETGKNFTEGNRPSTPSERGDMAMMHRNAGMANDMAGGMSSDQIAKKYGPDPRRMAGANGVVSFPGYRAHEQKYSGYDPVNKPTDSGNPVRVIGQGEDRTYINGVDQTPTAHEKALELTQAKVGYKPRTYEELKEISAKKGKDYEGETKLEKMRQEGRMDLARFNQGSRDARQKDMLAERKQYHDNIMQARLAEMNQRAQTAAQRAAVSNANAYLLNGQKLTPEGQQVLAKVQRDAMVETTNRFGPVNGAPQAPQAPQPNGGAVQVQSMQDAMKLPSGTRFIDPSGTLRVVP